jgi:hypothetical protein
MTPKEKQICQTASPELYAMDIAILCKCELQEVYRAVRKFNLVTKKFAPGLTKAQQDKVRELASPTTGLRSLSRATGATERVIELFMNKNNLPRKRHHPPTQPVKSGKDVFCWEDFENGLF